MNQLDKLSKLKKQAESAQREADKAQGALEQILSQLKEDFDCETLEDAETLLDKLGEKERTKAEAFDTALAEFEEKYGDKLGG